MTTPHLNKKDIQDEFKRTLEFEILIDIYEKKQGIKGDFFLFIPITQDFFMI